MSFAIHGIGTAHPPDAVTAEEGLALARVLAGPDVRTSTWLGPIYSNSGLRQRFQIIGGSAKRDALAGTNDSGSPFLPTPDNEGTGPTTGERMAIYAQEVGPLALRASASALAESGFAPDTITHLVTVSCTGFVAPGVDFALITGLRLKPTVARTHVGFMGCHGALNGLRVANAFASADPSARVLVCAVELSSLHYYYGSAADKLIANSIFADGAAAVVGCGRPGAEPNPLTPFPKKEGGTEPRAETHHRCHWRGVLTPLVPRRIRVVSHPELCCRYGLGGRRPRVRDVAVAPGAGADRGAPQAVDRIVDQ